MKLYEAPKTKRKENPQVGDTRKVKRFALIPTFVSTSGTMYGIIWFESYYKIQKYTGQYWETIQKLDKTYKHIERDEDYE